MRLEQAQQDISTRTIEDVDALLEDIDVRCLILHNDDINTFDWVIESIIRICDYSPSQAEQLTMLVHYKGKANVKKGTYEDLKPLKERFISRGINSTID